MRILHLYRPTLPSLRAQAIQVVHACHAFAARGHEVTLLANRAVDRPGAQVEDVLAAFGLAPVEGLDLRLSPGTHPTAQGLWFRRELFRWWMGAPGMVLAREKKRLRPLQRLPRRHRFTVESHELDSALAREAGKDDRAWRVLERAVVRDSEVLVANCGGTLRAWEQAYPEDVPTLRAAVHNATAPSRLRPAAPSIDRVARVVGSPKAYKGLERLLADAALWPLPLELVGGSEAEVAALPRRPNVVVRAAVPYLEVPDLLARSAVLVLPLDDNLFGRELTSPLKLWDYLATASPIVAPDLPSVREIAALSRAPLHLWRLHEEGDLHRAVEVALSAPPREPILRTWDDRAAEIEALWTRTPSPG